MTSSHLRALLTFGLVAIAATTFAQQASRDSPARPTTGTAAIVGTLVSDEGTSHPIRRAIVNLNNSDAPLPRQSATDDEGRFAFADLPAGHYTLYANKAAYAQAYYGARQPWVGPSAPITLAEGQRLTADLRMARGAVITGTILDMTGKPQSGVRVMAMRFRMVAGERQPQPAAAGGGNLLTQTDDRGVYRLFGLPPAEYTVAASTFGSSDARQITQAEVQWAQQQMRGGQVSVGTTPVVGAPPAPGPAMGYAPVFFPGTPDPSASTTISLAAGEERTGVDFPLQWVPTSRVEGTVLDADARPAPAVAISLIGKRSIPILTNAFPGMSRTDPSGKFSLVGVLPGEYTLLVRAGPSGPVPSSAGRAGGSASRPMTWAQQDLSINGSDVTGINLRLQPGLTISGHLVFDGTNPPPADLARVTISLGPAPGVSTAMLGGSGQVTSDGTFTLQGATPGRYRLNVNVPMAMNGGTAPGSTPIWNLKSIVSSGVETLDAGLEVSNTDVTGLVATFTDRPTELSGRLLDATGQPAPGYWVVAFSTDRTFWTPLSRRVRTARPDAEGKYRFAGMPPGDYYLIALTDLEQADMADAAFLDQLARASYKITLAEGEKKAQDLKLSGG